MIVTVREELEAAGLLVDADALVVRPADVASLARAVSILWRRRMPIHAYGDAGPGGAVVDLAKLSAVVAIDAATGIARVEAGCPVDALEGAVRKAGATLGPLLPSVLAGSVGGWLAGPTRGERGIPGARRETAALSVQAILADGRIAESRAAPRSATGPDLDHLALGEGRLCIIAAAVIRLFPAAAASTATFVAPSLGDAIDAIARLCRDRVEPSRAVVRASPGGAQVALSWEGSVAAPLHRARAIRALEGWSMASGVEAVDPSRGAGTIEVDALWEALSGLAHDGAATAFGLVGMHAGGAFGVVECGSQPAEICAAAARGPGLRIIAPRSLRDPGPGWDAMGASAAFARLSAALAVEPA
ncbi:MAG: FAD-binding oxidoreductase [Myxococcales bacterium]